MNSKSPKRIAYVVNRFDVGGLERYIARMCNHLPKDEFVPELICLKSAGHASDWLNDSEVLIHELNATRGNDRRFIKKLRSLIIDRKFDIVQSHNWGTLIETFSACRSLTPELSHIHAERGTVLGPDCTTRWKRFIRSFVMRFVLPRVTGTVCNAFAIEKKIRECTGLHTLPIEVIPNGLEMPITDANLRLMREQTRTMLGFTADTFVIGFLGRFAPVKNPGLVIDAFLRVLRTENEHSHDRIKLLLVGDGQLLEEQRQRVLNSGIDKHVIFAGEQTDSIRFLAAMDVMVNSSCSEGMSQAILEAMAVGVPVIVTDVGDSKRLIEGDQNVEMCGIAVASGDTQALANEMITLWSSTELRFRFSANARERFRNKYSLKTMVSNYQRYYSGFDAQTK